MGEGPAHNYNTISILWKTPNLLALLNSLVSAFVFCTSITSCSSGSSSASIKTQSLMRSKKPGFRSMYHCSSFLLITYIDPVKVVSIMALP